MFPDRLLEGWATLVAWLRWTALQETRGLHSPQLPQGLDASIGALLAVFNFLASHELICKDHLHIPILKILFALNDVAVGYRPPLFVPVVKGKFRKTSGEANIQGIAARALDELISASVTTDDAAKRVCAAMKAGRVAGYSKYKPVTVQQWRHRLNEGQGAMPEVALNRYKESIPPEAGSTPEERAAFLLDALKSNTVFRGR